MEIVYILFLLIALSFLMFCVFVIAGAVVLVLWDGYICPAIENAFIKPLRKRSEARQDAAETQRKE